jgi:WD40 repeat protein
LTNTWSAVGSGISISDPYFARVVAIAISPSGTIFIGGAFDTAGGSSNCRNIAYYNGTNWAPLSTGLNNPVRSLKFAPDGKLLIGGTFTNAAGTKGNYICWWNGSAFKSFTDLGATELNYWVNSIDINPTGTIIIGGEFTNAGGDTNATGVAAWHGNNWGKLAAGGVTSSAPLNKVSKVFCTSNGEIYISGLFTSVGYIGDEYSANLEVERVAKSVRGAWQRIDIDLPESAVPVLALLEASDGMLYLGGAFSTTASGENAVAAGVADIVYSSRILDIVISSGSANTYPYIEIIGPGKLNSIINYNTGVNIVFNNLILLSGERLKLILDPLQLKFSSSWAGRENVLRYVNAGSDYGNFYLKPGTNAISLFMNKSTTTTATKAWMAWKPRFWGIDGALLL